MKKFFAIAASLLLAMPAYGQVNFGTSASSTNPQVSGDATTGFFTPGSGDVAFSSSGNEIFRATGNGVAIGTTSPASGYELTLGGSMEITSGDININSGNHSVLASGGFLQLGTTASNPLYLLTNGSIRQAISSSGNVGIGTTSPVGILDVEGGTASSGNGTNITLGAQSGASSGNTNGGNIILNTGAANGTGTRGGVGINTTSPQALLEIDQSGPGAMINLSNTTTASGIYGTGIHLLNSNGWEGTFSMATSNFGGDSTYYAPNDVIVESFYSGAAIDIAARGTNSFIRFSTSPGATSESMRLASNGSLGIGTTSPQATLDVVGFERLKLNSSAPATCSSSNEGSIALTHLAQACVCDTTPAWHVLNSSTACSW